MKCCNLDITGYWVIGATCSIENWNFVPVLQIVQKIPKSYCPCLYLHIGKVWWLIELCFKKYIKKCTLSNVLIMTSKTTNTVPTQTNSLIILTVYHEHLSCVTSKKKLSKTTAIKFYPAKKWETNVKQQCIKNIRLSFKTFCVLILIMHISFCLTNQKNIYRKEPKTEPWKSTHGM